MVSFRKLTLLPAIPLLVLFATPAAAHGSMDSPASRAVARGIDDWDNVRVANVRGKDRQRIPDGRLCSAGIAEFGSLDVPESDGPATALSAGAEYTFKYRETIPHKGTFRLYVTKDGYDPARTLTWADLETRPFLSITDPASRDRSYVLEGKLPAAKTGRHLIYTIWQNSDTPDTYYSCSDVDFGVAETESALPSKPQATATPQAVAATSATSATSASESNVLPLAGGAAALLAGAVALFFLLRLRRRS